MKEVYKLVVYCHNAMGNSQVMLVYRPFFLHSGFILPCLNIDSITWPLIYHTLVCNKSSRG